MKFLKKILVTLIAAIITTVAVYGGYTIYAAGKYDFEAITTVNTMRLYHKGMNKLFNDSLAKAVVILVDPKKGIDSPNLRSPCSMSQFQEDNGTANCEKKCMSTPENVSTYCVSVRAMDMYVAYIFHLGKLQGSVNLESIAWSNPTTNWLYAATLDRDSKIEKDIEESRRVLEASLTAYNEFMVAYPIHKQYQTIIKNLIKYKNKLKDIRDYAIQFPTTFIDSTSTKCS